MRNIILLSDGTGNGAAKRNKTNVWRMYSALDRHRNDQIAFYDDGVGSQEFLLFKIIGGAFGWGLKRNVIELYKFLCRNYKTGDNIYLFGFSRGAFTVRVLAGMINYCGLLTDCRDEQLLHKTAREKFNVYRYERYNYGYLSRAFRVLTSVFRRKSERGGNVKPRIKFIGVWDTVDAYGLPIDELAVVWNKFISPIRFPDQKLSEKVDKACHALSIDDERHSFHPVLWDESEEVTNRIEQVWLPGVHSDVGGGYPMKDLALISLDWMISRVEARDSNNPNDPGLHFISHLRKEFISQSDWHGKQHDSRAGFASYYRYKPRLMEHICKDPGNGIEIDNPKIHRSVMERIQGNAVPYAPIGLPDSYQIVATRGDVKQYETAEGSCARKNALSNVLKLISWRKRLYFALLITSFTLLGSRFFLPWSKEGVCMGSACVLEPVLNLASSALPDITAGWFEALKQNPFWLWGFIISFLVLFILKKYLWNQTQYNAMAAWAVLKSKDTPPI
jgi:hypothetical protein